MAERIEKTGAYDVDLSAGREWISALWTACMNGEPRNEVETEHMVRELRSLAARVEHAGAHGIQISYGRSTARQHGRVVFTGCHTMFARWTWGPSVEIVSAETGEAA